MINGPDDEEDGHSGRLSAETPDTGSVEPAFQGVGYRKPPVASRFKKGVSGNPKGRPRGRRSFKTELREVLDAKVVVTEGGRKSKVSTSHAMLLRLRQQALNGDVRAIDRLLLYAAAHLPADPPEDVEAIFREDEDIIAAYRRSPSSATEADDA